MRQEKRMSESFPHATFISHYIVAITHKSFLSRPFLSSHQTYCYVRNVIHQDKIEPKYKTFSYRQPQSRRIFFHVFFPLTYIHFYTRKKNKSISNTCVTRMQFMHILEKLDNVQVSRVMPTKQKYFVNIHIRQKKTNI